MTRTYALLLAIAALLVACGKYGPPRRVRPEPSVSPTAELETGQESPDPAGSSAAEPEPDEATEDPEVDEQEHVGDETDAESPESDDGQEKEP